MRYKNDCFPNNRSKTVEKKWYLKKKLWPKQSEPNSVGLKNVSYKCVLGSIAGLSGRMPPKKGEKETLPDGVPANWSAWRLSRDEQDRRESSSIDVSHMHSQITCMQTRKNKKKNKKQKQEESSENGSW